MNRRRLYRCYHDHKIAGVSSGLAEYLDIDVTLIRILFLVSIFFGGLGLLLYIVMALLVPMEPAESAVPAPDANSPEAVIGHRHATGGGTGGTGLGATFLGIVLVLGGGLALLDAMVPAFGDGRFWWPAFILGLGIVIIAMAVQRRQNQS